MSANEQQYLDHMRKILDEGKLKENRTGVGTLSIFGAQMRFDLRQGFPLLTTKKMFTRGILAELVFFLNGSTDNNILKEQNVHIWDEWEGEDGDLGPIYGAQWRRWQAANGTHDQLHSVLEELEENPDSRRLIVSAWNVGQLEDMALPPCHTMFQLYSEPRASGGRYLDLQLYQRSADWFLGVPFNIASYSFLLTIIAKHVGMTPRYFIHSLGDTHLYENHLIQAVEQIGRKPFDCPELVVDERMSVFEYEVSDFHIKDYACHPAIKGDIAV